MRQGRWRNNTSASTAGLRANAQPTRASWLPYRAYAAAIFLSASSVVNTPLAMKAKFVIAAA